MRFHTKVFRLILFVAIIKIALSAFLELSNDEVYYIVYARQFHLNYFDHPPFVGIILKFFSLNLFLKHEIFLRLGFIACGAGSCYLVFLTGKKIYNDYTGWLAALLFAASIYGNIICGMMIMPDGPMLLFWLWAFYNVVSIVQSKDQQEVNKNLLWFGIICGLAMMSKISAGMLWGGMVLYILFFSRDLLKNKYLYFSAAISLLIVSPVLADIFFKHSAGAAYHTSRVAINNATHFQPSSFLRQFIGEIGYNNPICYFLSVIGLIYCVKRRWLPKKILALLICFALPLILMVWGIALFKNTLPHWTGPSFVILLFFAAIFLAKKTEGKPFEIFPRVLLWANGIVAAALLVIVMAVYFLPVSFNKNDDNKIGSGDLLLDFSGWKFFKNDFEKMYKQDSATGRMKPGAFLIATNWFPAAHADWYIAGPTKIPFFAVGEINAIHEYARLNQLRQQLNLGDDAYYLRVSNYFTDTDSALTSYFSKIDAVEMIPQLRAGKKVRKFILMRLHDYKGGISNTGIIK